MKQITPAKNNFRNNFLKLLSFTVDTVCVFFFFRSVVGQNYTIVGRLLIITLSVGHAPTMGFSLSFSSSGESGRQVLTGYAGLTTASGNYSYPENGERYGNNEDALFLIAPTVPAQPTLRFTYVDIEFGSGCLYDQLAVFTWFDNEYKQTAR